MPGIFDSTDLLLRSVDVDPAFFRDLRTNDDWSFLIKGHALVEAALAHYIIERFGNPNLAPRVKRLHVTQKLQWFVPLGGSQQIQQFINALSGLRNDAVHKPEGLRFSFDSWLLTQKERAGYTATVRNLILPFKLYDQVPGAGSETVAQQIQKLPGALKGAVWICLAFTIGKLYEHAASVIPEYALVGADFEAVEAGRRGGHQP